MSHDGGWRGSCVSRRRDRRRRWLWRLVSPFFEFAPEAFVMLVGHRENGKREARHILNTIENQPAGGSKSKGEAVRSFRSDIVLLKHFFRLRNDLEAGRSEQIIDIRLKPSFGDDHAGRYAAKNHAGTVA